MVWWLASMGAEAYEVMNGHNASSWLISSPADSGSRSGIRVMKGKQAALCVPPKCGSTAVWAMIPGMRLEWIGESVTAKAETHDNDPMKRSEGSHQKIERWLFDADRVRVAILRHPVDRILSSMRAFGLSEVCKSCRSAGLTALMRPKPGSSQTDFEAAMLHYALHDLPRQTTMDCAAARAFGPTHLNQHFRSLRCFCGFELPGMVNRTHLLRFGDDADVARLADLIPDAETWNAPIEVEHANGLRPTEALLKKNHHIFHTTQRPGAPASYSPDLIDAIARAVEPDLAFFRRARLVFEPLPAT